MRVHLIVQGKGGVGKSMAAATLAMWLTEKGEPPLCVDTDPVNGTFAGYRALNVRRLELLDEEREVDPRRFDELIELIVAGEQGAMVVDNGASSFVPFTSYLLSNSVPDLLTEMGHDVVVHTIITGGQALRDTVSGFAQLAEQLPPAVTYVVWLNPYFGGIEIDGKGFEGMKAYRAHHERVAALVKVPALKRATHGQDFQEMLQARATFDEAIADPARGVMTRQRLKMVRSALFAQLERAAVA